MQAYRISARSGKTSVGPLPLPSLYRRGDIPWEFYARQASGDMPIWKHPLTPSRFIRTAMLKDGPFLALAADSGPLLTFVISGVLTLRTDDGRKTELKPGDLFLVDEESASRVGLAARDTVRLVQLDVAPDWPGPNAKIQEPGSPIPSDGLKLKRMYTAEDNRSYYREFSELFPAPPNEWSPSRPVLGLRFLCWEDGFIDWHPEVVNNFPIFLSGEISVEVSGDRTNLAFRAGDICLAEDRTGRGHIDRCRGMTHVAMVILETKDLW